MGIQSAVFILVPLRFLDGYHLMRWHRWLWAASFLAAAFAFFTLMVSARRTPASPRINAATQSSRL